MAYNTPMHFVPAMDHEAEGFILSASHVLSSFLFGPSQNLNIQELCPRLFFVSFAYTSHFLGMERNSDTNTTNVSNRVVSGRPFVRSPKGITSLCPLSHIKGQLLEQDKTKRTLGIGCSMWMDEWLVGPD